MRWYYYPLAIFNTTLCSALVCRHFPSQSALDALA